MLAALTALTFLVSPRGLAAAPAAEGGRTPKPTDPIALIQGSADAWSVARGDAGCYLMSPRRARSSRLALGRHPTLGLGLFVVDFGLAILGPDGREPVTVHAGQRDIGKTATMAANKLLFIPLDAGELAADLETLRATGTLWLVVRGAWLSHGGLGVAAAVDEYGRVCGAAAPPAP